MEKQSRKCALSGVDLVLLPDWHDPSCNVSIDRKDSTIGYTMNNVQLVTKQVNVAKHILTNEQFIDLCKNVTKYANQQPSLI